MEPPMVPIIAATNRRSELSFGATLAVCTPWIQALSHRLFNEGLRGQAQKQTYLSWAVLLSPRAAVDAAVYMQRDNVGCNLAFEPATVQAMCSVLGNASHRIVELGSLAGVGRLRLHGGHQAGGEGVGSRLPLGRRRWLLPRGRGACRKGRHRHLAELCSGSRGRG